MFWSVVGPEKSYRRESPKSRQALSGARTDLRLRQALKVFFESHNAPSFSDLWNEEFRLLIFLQRRDEDENVR
jgi:hypothetical protein